MKFVHSKNVTEELTLSKADIKYIVSEYLKDSIGRDKILQKEDDGEYYLWKVINPHDGYDSYVKLRKATKAEVASYVVLLGLM